MKNVLLIIDSSESEFGSLSEFDTVAEAQAWAAKIEGKIFDIFSLYTHGEIGDITWKTQADTATNFRENEKFEVTKKEKIKLRRGAWSPTEVATLIKNFEAGMTISDLAAALKRAYNSIYTKLTALGLK